MASITAIKTNITRISNAKSDIIAAINNKGVVCASTAKIEDLADKINDIAADGASENDGVWELLAEQTLTEIAKTISVTLSKNIKNIIVKIYCPATGASATQKYVNIAIGGQNLFYYIPADIPDKSLASQLTAVAESIGSNYWHCSYFMNLGDRGADEMSQYNPRTYIIDGVKKLTLSQTNKVSIQTVTNETDQQFPIGTVFRVWGR